MGIKKRVNQAEEVAEASSAVFLDDSPVIVGEFHADLLFDYFPVAISIDWMVGRGADFILVKT
jgi:hypothetical protein